MYTKQISNQRSGIQDFSTSSGRNFRPTQEENDEQEYGSREDAEANLYSKDGDDTDSDPTFEPLLRN